MQLAQTLGVIANPRSHARVMHQLQSIERIALLTLRAHGREYSLAASGNQSSVPTRLNGRG